MNEIRFQYLSAKEVEQKYSDYECPLVFQYIGPNRTHGDGYYNLNWYEIIYSYKPVGLICFDFNRFKNTIHLSVLEIFEKNQGLGTKTMDYLFELAKSLQRPCITLQCNNRKAKTFYLRCGFRNKTIDNCPYLIKYL